ncbi:MAG TPA: hypothetical protein VFO62_06995 [Candidatus Binatia bacterium]|nr:hypothetical protein [Candidatus Binatia bacterium]
MRKRASLLIIGLCLLSACVSETRESSVRTHTGEAEWALLIPDWKNDVVHRVSRDGRYLGDFLDASRRSASEVPPRAWQSPRGLLFLPDSAGSLWLAAERGLSEWAVDGTYRRALVLDSAQLQDPVAIARVGDEIFVVNEDKKNILVFNRAGERVRSFGYPELDRATDCKVGPDGMLYVTSSLRHSDQKGLISVWDPKNKADDAKPVRHLVPPAIGDDGGTVALQSLVFDDDGNLIVTHLFRGRVERWSTASNTKIAVLLNAGKPGAYKELARGPDGLVYVTGTDGVYRFAANAAPEELASLTPFFDAHQIGGRYEHPFSPQSMIFVPTASLAQSNVANSLTDG